MVNTLTFFFIFPFFRSNTRCSISFFSFAFYVRISIHFNECSLFFKSFRIITQANRNKKNERIKNGKEKKYKPCFSSNESHEFDIFLAYIIIIVSPLDARKRLYVFLLLYFLQHLGVFHLWFLCDFHTLSHLYKYYGYV